jgi:hypothetical protein
MTDEFYLPDDVVEWVAQKKSELLAWVLEHRDDFDIPFEEFEDYTEKVPDALAQSDEVWIQKWDGHTIQIQLKMFETEQIFWLLVISLKSKVLNDEDVENDILVPILVIPTKHTMWLKKWLSGEKIQTRFVH